MDEHDSSTSMKTADIAHMRIPGPFPDFWAGPGDEVI